MGRIAVTCWNNIPDHFPSVRLDVSVVMPDHVHGIIVLRDGNVTLGTIIGNYKAAVTRQIRRELAGTDGIYAVRTNKIWQERYHDHIVRNAWSLRRIRQYIVNNPARWNNGR